MVRQSATTESGLRQPATETALIDWAAEAVPRGAVWLRRPENAVFIGIVLVALLLRTWDLGTRAIHHDESLHGYYSWLLVDGGVYIHNPLLHGTTQFIATGFVFQLLGASDVTLRLLPALTGTIVAALPFVLFRDMLGRWGAVAASALIAISPGMLYFSRFARNDVYMVLVMLVLVWTMWRYMETPRLRYLAIAAATLAVGFATKEVMYLFVTVILLYLVARVAPMARDLLRTPVRAWPPAAVYAMITAALVLPLGGAAIGVVQSPLGLALVNEDAGGIAGGGIGHLPGPVGAPISQGPGFASGLLEGVAGVFNVNVAGLSQLQAPAAGVLTLGGLTFQALDVAVIVLAVLFATGAVFGLLWNPGRWLLLTGIFWAIMAILFTSLFTNWVGLGSGVWQSLGYWLAQQEVARGGQPWYYYFAVLGTYEFLPLAVALVTGFVMMRRRDEFGQFLVFWFAVTLVLFTMAGEKMPWLSIHLTLPLILLAGRGIAEYLPRSITAIRALPTSPTRRNAGHGAAVLALSVMLALTAGFSVRASFTNGDVPVEMLVYTQTSPALADAVDEIELYGAMTGEGAAIPITVDTAQGFAWPWYWYLRDYTHVQYRCVGDGAVCGGESWPVTSVDPPAGRVVIVNPVNEAAIVGGMGAFGQPVRIPLRWWFPESVYRGADYGRGLTPVDVARGTVDPGAWSTIWAYWTARDLPQALGRSDILVYFPTGYTPALTTPPDPVFGPA